MAPSRLVRRAASLAALALVLGGAAPAKPPERPKRIVSLNLCADQLVLALADRSQIAALTRNAANPELSAAAAQARGLRILGTSLEEILEIDPDLVVGTPTLRSLSMAAIKRQNYRVVPLPAAETLDEIFAAIRQTAVAVGHPERGEALIARMRADLARLPRPGHGKVAAYYQRRGFLTGTGTLIDELMGRLGLVNLARKLGKPPLSQVSLEEMVAARPDYLVVESATDKVTDLGTEMLHHPALDGIPRISLPQAWTVCGGPAYVQAAQGMVRQMERQGRPAL